VTDDDKAARMILALVRLKDEASDPAIRHAINHAITLPNDSLARLADLLAQADAP
jgi:hypothetical protein